MKGQTTTGFRLFPLLVGLIFCLSALTEVLAAPSSKALSVFDSYVTQTETRLAQQHQTPPNFLADEGFRSQTQAQLRQEGLIIEKLSPPNGGNIPGAMLHHWRGTAFAPGAKAADFERLVRNFSAYPRTYAPQVLQAQVLNQQGDHLQAEMRVRQKHVITVVLDTTYDVSFAHLDPQHGYSLSRSTRISEIASPGTPQEHALGPEDEHGFLWKLNSYWSYEERDGGLYMQIESISLSRSIPTGLGWAVRPFVESVPRESLEFTLRATCNALRK